MRDGLHNCQAPLSDVMSSISKKAPQQSVSEVLYEKPSRVSPMSMLNMVFNE